MKAKLIYNLILASGVIFLFGGCSKSGSAPMTTGKPNSATYAASVNISNFTFSPASVTVLTGGSVTWTNKDAVDHTATDLSGNFDSGHINPSQTFKFTFTKAGTYTYHCSIHSMMPNATVVVVNN
ncbi:MAG: cupredoxin domain-containing protein [Bacteroidetes bacterium]|nr:cupredoxin domain-containing protein [Bacteroidota bacterium]